MPTARARACCCTSCCRRTIYPRRRVPTGVSLARASPWVCYSFAPFCCSRRLVPSSFFRCRFVVVCDLVHGGTKGRGGVSQVSGGWPRGRGWGAWHKVVVLEALIEPSVILRIFSFNYTAVGGEDGQSFVQLNPFLTSVLDIHT